jgi:acyl-CoA synthetase (AMP-forming)/AMP-acid ligase II
MNKAAGKLSSMRIIRLDKVSGPSFVEALADVWRTGSVAMPLDAGAGTPAIGMAVANRIALEPGGGWIKPQMPAVNEDEPALISFTSGTTGEPKAILISHGALADVTRRLTEIMRMDSSIREYVAVPVTFSFGAGRIRAIAEVGGAAFIPEHGFRPDQLAEMLDAGEVNALSAVPSMLRLILAQPSMFKRCGSKLLWMEIGSQYMSGAEKQSLRALFPNARIVQHYGLTEASRSTFLVVSEAKAAELETVGRATGNVEVRIEHDGVIAIKGDHVATCRIADGRFEALTDAEGWLRTADIGRLNEGLLTYLGRSDDVANIAGIKVSAEKFEQHLFQELDGASDCTAVCVGEDAIRGQQLIVAFTDRADRRQIEAAVRLTAKQFGLRSADVRLARVRAIPRTDTGKIQRKLLAAAVDESTPELPLASNEMSPTETKLALMWSEILGVGEIDAEDSFFDLGGDSLSAVMVALRAGEAGLSADIMHHMFEGRTVREIAALLDGEVAVTAAPTRRAQLSLAINAARGVLVLMVIGSHWLPFFWERAGAAGATFAHWAAPVFHIGTPGFAIIFGVGLIFFYRPIMERSPASFRRKVHSNAAFLAVGIFLSAAVGVAILLVQDGGLGRIWPEKLFYSVILFYFLMVITVDPLLRAIYSSDSPAQNSLLLAAGGVSITLFFQYYWALANGSGGARLVQHMLVAPYAYPHLLAAVCIGASLGVWLQSLEQDARILSRAVKGALVLLGFGILGVACFTAGWWVVAQSAAAFPAYAGGVILVLSAMLWLVQRELAFRSVRLLAAIGLLAFPAFVTHGLVIAIKDLLVALSVPYPLALSLPLTLFVVGAVLAIRRVYSMLFGGAHERRTLGNASPVSSLN